MKKVILACLISIFIAVGAFLTACEKTDIHDEEHLTKHPAVAATCVTDGNDEYYECSECGKFFIKDGDSFEEVTEGSWVKKATGVHQYGEEIPEVAADCAQGTDGVKAHYECGVCHNKFVKEGDAYVQQTNEQLAIPAEHDYGEEIGAVASTCETQGTIAHYDCSVCHKHFVKEGDAYVEKTDEQIKAPLADHAYGDEIGATEGDCETGEPGIMAHYECENCGKYFVKEGDEYIEREYEELKVEARHTFTTETAAVPSTCETNGSKAYWECQVCRQKYFKTADGTYQFASDEAIKEPLAAHDFSAADAHHTMVAATCTADGNIDYYHCATCKKDYTKGEDDTYTLANKTAIDKLGHDFSKEEKHHEATFSCDHAGDIEYWECDRCGKKFASNGDLYSTEELQDSEIHKEATGAHTFVDDTDHHHEREEATCEAEGEVEWWECTVCHNKYATQESQEKLDDLTIAKKDHDFSGDAHHERKEATCMEQGNKEYYECQTCHKKFEKNTENGGNDISDDYIIEIDATAHKYSDTPCESKESTCKTAGYDKYACELNPEHEKKTVARELDSSKHEYADTYEYDDENHWHPITCEHNSDGNLKKEAHNYGEEGGTVCLTCDYDKNFANFTFQLNGDSYTITEYKGAAAGEGVVIPSMYMGKKVTAIDQEVFMNKNITSVVIPNGITDIKDRAFKNTKLTKVELPDSVLLTRAIGGHHYMYIFEDCSELEEVILGEGVEYLDYTFRNCPSLKTVVLSTKLTYIGEYAFSNDATSLYPTSGHFYAKNTTTVSFGSCANLLYYFSEAHPADHSKNYWHWDEQQENRLVWDNGSVGFIYTSNDNGETYQLTGIDDEQFALDPDGVSLEIASQYNEKPVTEIAANALKGKDFIKGITFVSTNYWASQITKIGESAFEGSGLRSITLSDSITTIDSKAFYNCAELSAVTINGTSNLLTIGDSAFEGTIVASITLPEQLTTIGASAFKGTKVTKIALPDTVNSIGESAFENCENLEYVLFGEGIISIEANVLKGATGLKRVVFGPAVNIKAGAFDGVTLDTVFYKGTSESDWTSNVMVEGNNGNVEEAKRIYYSADKVLGDERWHFSSGSDEPTIWSPYSENLDYVVSGDFAYLRSIDRCTDTKIVVSPTYSEGGKEYPVTQIGNGSVIANSKQYSTLEIVLPTSITKISDNAFERMQSLTIDLSGLTALQEIGSRALYNVPIKKIKLSATVTTIGSEAFNNELYGDTGRFTYLVIPKDIESIGANAIKNDAQLKDRIYYAGSQEEWTAKLEIIQDTNITAASEGGKIKFYRSEEDWPETKEEAAKLWHYGASGDPEMYTVEDYTQGLEFTLNESEYYVSGYTGDATEIVIPNNYKGKPVTKINADVFSGKSNITKVTLGEYVAEIGANAFKGTGIANINLIGVTTIGASAFEGCSSLEWVILDKELASLDETAFNSCSAFETIYFFGNSDEYSSCAAKAAIDALGKTEGTYYYTAEQPADGKWWKFGEDGKTPEVWTFITFQLEETGVDGEYKITKILRYDEAVKEGVLTIPAEQDGKKIVEIAWNYLEFDPSAYTGITEIKFEGNNLKRIGNNAFTNLRGIKKLILPEGLVSVGDDAFAVTATGVEDAMTEIVLPDSLTTIGGGVRGAFFRGTMPKLTKVIIGDGVQSIPKGAFAAKTIETLVIGANVTEIDSGAFTSMSYATSWTALAVNIYFKGNKETWDARINEFAYTGFTNIGKLGFDKFHVYFYSDVNSEGKWHYKDDNADGSYTIELWEGLKPTEGLKWEGNDDSGWIIAGFESEPESPIDLVIPATHESGIVTEIKDRAFQNKANIKSLYIPKTSNLTKIGTQAFSGCSALEKVVIQKDLTFTVNSDYGVFYNCTALKTVILDGVTTVGQSTFSYCSAVETVIFDGVTTLGAKVFNQLNEKLNTVVLGTLTSVESNSFVVQINKSVNNAKLYFKGTSDDYSSGDNKLSNCSMLAGFPHVEYSAVDQGGKWHYVDETHTDYNYDIAIWEVKIEDMLKFEDDNSGGYIIAGFETEPDEPIDLVIPATHNGGNVTGIKQDAFRGSAKIKSLTINQGNHINTIGAQSFYQCNTLVSVYIYAEEEITWGYVSDYGPFAYCNQLNKVVLDGALTTVGHGAFYYCGNNFKTVILGENITTIDVRAFSSNSYIETFVCGKITSIQTNSFSMQYGSCKLYFRGTDSDWSDTANSNLNGCQRYYFSAGADSGKWHFNNDGMPELWP